MAAILQMFKVACLILVFIFISNQSICFFIHRYFKNEIRDVFTEEDFELYK